MEQQRITQHPTAANLSAAWEEYAAITRQFYADPGLWADVDFVNGMARALGRYMHLYNRVGANDL